MNKYLILIFLFVLGMPVFSQQNEYVDFAFRFYNQTEKVQNTQKGNIVTSPLSAQFTLGMLLNGAYGENYEEISRTLGTSAFSLEQINAYNHNLLEKMPETTVIEEYEQLFQGFRDPKGLPKLNFANGIWTDLGYSPLEDFKQATESVYDAEIQEAELGKKETFDGIDKWVSNKTDGAIPSMGIEPNDLMSMALTSVTSFKGEWLTMFAEGNVIVGDFSNYDGTVVPVTYMKSDMRVNCYKDEELEACKLFYGCDNKFSMTIILPAQDNKDLVLDAEKWKKIQDGFQENYVCVKIPYLNLYYEQSMIPVLKAMGMDLAFQGGGFGKLSETEGLKVDNAKQVCSIKVNEKGSDDPTTSRFPPNSFGWTNYYFYATRSFYFTIEDNQSGTILFVGKINQLDELTNSVEKVPVTPRDDAPLYDLSGRRLQQKPQKGIYIENGRLRVSEGRVK